MSAKGTRLSPESKARIGESNRRRYADPALRAAVSERIRKLWETPEYRAKHVKRTPEEIAEYRKAWHRANYRQNPEPHQARAREWWEANRERARATRREYGKKHPEAARERIRRWMEDPENRAKTYARLRAYMKAHPELRQRYAANRRARLIDQFIEEVDRNEVYRRGNGLCGICGDPVDPERFDVDHIIPLLVGGEHSYANTQPAHPSCNYRKPKRPKEIAA